VHTRLDVTRPSSNGRRIAYIISLFTEDCTFIVREIDELVARGWDIRIFSLKPARIGRTELRARTYYSPFLLSAQVLWSVLCFLIRKPTVVGRILGLVAVHFWRKPSLLIKNLAVLPKCLHHARTIEALGCTHIHAHWATVSTFAALSMSRLTGIPFSFTGHAWDIFVDTTMLAYKVEAASAVVTCTDYNRRYLHDVVGHAAHGKVRAVYHGIRLEAYTPRAVARSPSPFRMISVGRWVPQKGFDVLVRALDVLRREGIPFELIIVAPPGQARYEHTVRSLVRSLGLDPWVRTLAFVPHEELMELVRACSVMVLAAVQDETGAQDGIPNVLIESLAVGTPVVSTRLSGIPELVREGHSGVLVPSGDHEALARALAWCAGNAETLDAYGANGRRLVHREFDIRKNVALLEPILGADDGPPRELALSGHYEGELSR
jgi:colanic acid/amylovoran biosynthesis glycosyltransferase